MRGRKLVLAVSLLGLALSTAACTRATADDREVATAATAGRAGGTPSPTPSLSFEQRLRQWVECMRGEGIDLPDPARNAEGKIAVEPAAGTEKGGPLEEKYRDAEQKCRKLDPNEAELKPFSAEELEAQREWAKCMRDQGIEMNDPNPNGMPALPKRGMHYTEVELNKATQACRDKMPRMRPGGQ